MMAKTAKTATVIIAASSGQGSAWFTSGGGLASGSADGDAAGSEVGFGEAIVGGVDEGVGVCSGVGGGELTVRVVVASGNAI